MQLSNQQSREFSRKQTGDMATMTATHCCSEFIKDCIFTFGVEWQIHVQYWFVTKFTYVFILNFKTFKFLWKRWMDTGRCPLFGTQNLELTIKKHQNTFWMQNFKLCDLLCLMPCCCWCKRGREIDVCITSNEVKYVVKEREFAIFLRIYPAKVQFSSHDNFQKVM